jgi:hypothetical protein
MKRAVGILCAGLLLMGAGCVWQFGNTRVEADVQIDEKALDMTLDRAVAKVQAELQKRGLEVTVNPDGDAMRLVCKGRTGGQFTVVLSRARTESGQEQTKARIDWNGTSRDVGLLFALEAVAVQPAR